MAYISILLESKSSLTRWRHRFIWHRCWCYAKGDTLAPYLLIICPRRRTLNVDRSYERKWLYTKNKARSRRYPAEPISDTDYADDIALLENAATKAESLLHSLEQAAGGIDFHVNPDKTKYMCFNKKGDIATLNGVSSKSVDKFTYFRSSISSTENDINIQIAKAWTATDRLWIIWKSDLSDKIDFFQLVVGIFIIWMHHKDADWANGKKLDGNCTRRLRALLNKY